MIQVDRSRYPLVTITFAEELGAYEIDAYARECADNFESREVHAYAIRTLEMKLPEMASLKRLGDWVKDNTPQLSSYVAGTGLCIPSPALRGALKFINTIAPPPAPQATFADWQSTIDWADAQLREWGVHRAREA